MKLLLAFPLIALVLAEIKPSKIKGSAEVLHAGDWSAIEKLIQKEVK
jgi:hypothetical protein